MEPYQHTQNNVSSMDLHNMMKDLKQETLRQSQAMNSKINAIVSDVAFIKNELSRQSRWQTSDSGHRLASLTFCELQTLCQLVVPALEIAEENINDADDPDDLYLNIYFHGEKDVLSTFYPFELSLNGKMFKSAEHLFQYKKAEALGQIAAGDEILKAADGRAAKAVAKRIINVTPEWEGLKEGVMEDVLHVKAMQCREFCERLLMTGNRPLVHDVPDPIWGWGKDGFGGNLMGRCLVKTRCDLQDRSSSVFMDDDLGLVDNPVMVSPTGFRSEEEYFNDDAYDCEYDPQKDNHDNSSTDPKHMQRENRRKGKGSNKKQSGKNVPKQNSEHDKSGKGQRKGNISERPHSANQRSVWSGGSGQNLHVNVPAENFRQPSNENIPVKLENERGVRRGRKNQRKNSDRGKGPNTNNHANVGGGYANEEPRPEFEIYNDHRNEMQYYGQQSRNNTGNENRQYRQNYYFNNSRPYRGGFPPSRQGRPNHRRGRENGQNNYRNRRNSSGSDNRGSAHKFKYEGRMYSDRPDEEGGLEHDDSGGKNNATEFHQRDNNSRPPRHAGRGYNKYKSSPKQAPGQGNDTPHDPSLGNGGNLCHVDASHEEDVAVVNVPHPDVKASSDDTLVNPQGHPENASYL